MSFFWLQAPCQIGEKEWLYLSREAVIHAGFLPCRYQLKAFPGCGGRVGTHPVKIWHRMFHRRAAPLLKELLLRERSWECRWWDASLMAKDGLPRVPPLCNTSCQVLARNSKEMGDLVLATWRLKECLESHEWATAKSLNTNWALTTKSSVEWVNQTVSQKTSWYGLWRRVEAEERREKRQRCSIWQWWLKA